MLRKNKYSFWTSCQSTIHELYVIKKNVVLGKTTTTKQYQRSNTHNCESMFWCYDHHGGKEIPKSVSNQKQSYNAMQRSPICLTDSDHEYTIDEIKHIETI